MASDDWNKYSAVQLLHDVGKIGIPDNILRKPGPLTDAEWEVMRRHPEYAFKLLSPIKYLGPALEIPYCHMNDGMARVPASTPWRTNSSGGTRIRHRRCLGPLCSDRPYRKAWTEDQAREYIRSNSVIMFDPRAVDIFVRLTESEQLTVKSQARQHVSTIPPAQRSSHRYPPNSPNAESVHALWDIFSSRRNHARNRPDQVVHPISAWLTASLLSQWSRSGTTNT